MKKYILKYQAVLFPILDIALNGANYIFHVYIAWYLITSDYGVLNALLSLSSLMLVTGISFQLYTAKYIAEGDIFAKSNFSSRVSEIRKVAFGIIGVLSSVFFILIVPIHNVTRGSYSALILLLIIFVMNIFLSINRGVIQGTKQFIHLNISFYVEVSTKIIFVFFLLRAFKNINSVLISIAIGMLVSLIHSMVVSRKLSGNNGEKEKVLAEKKHITRIIAIFAANFFTYFFTSLDILVVNYYLPDVSGYFAVVLKYTQILLYASVSVTTVFIPGLSAAKTNRHEFMKKIKLLFGLIALMIFLVVLGYSFLASPTVDMFFGKQYGMAKVYILPDCIPYALLILNFTVINIHIVFDNKKYLGVLLGFSILLLGLLIVFHQNLNQIIMIESIIYGAMLVSLIILFKKSFKKLG